MKRELEQLFYFNNGQEPLILSSTYTAGFLQRVRASVNLLQAEAVVFDKRLMYFRAGYGSEDHLRKAVASELGVVHSVIKHYLAALETEHDFGVARSLQCFDLEFWREQQMSDDAMPDP